MNALPSSDLPLTVCACTSLAGGCGPTSSPAALVAGAAPPAAALHPTTNEAALLLLRDAHPLPAIILEFRFVSSGGGMGEGVSLIRVVIPFRIPRCIRPVDHLTITILCRSLFKLASTWISPLPSLAVHDPKGGVRIHCRWNQVRTSQ